MYANLFVCLVPYITFLNRSSFFFLIRRPANVQNRDCLSMNVTYIYDQ